MTLQLSKKKPQGANSKVYLSKLGKLTGELILPKAGKYCTVIWGICQLPFNDSGTVADLL